MSSRPVQRTGVSSGEGWDRLQSQVTSLAWEPDTSNNANGGVDEDIVEIEPAGGLERDEIAELVAVYTTASLSQAMITSVTTAAALTAGIRWTTDDDETVYEDDVDRQLGNSTTLPSGNDFWFNQDEDEPGALYEYVLTAQSQESNGGDSVGRGGDTDSFQQLRHYRADFGGGPIFDRHDAIHVHGFWDNLGGTTEYILREETHWLWQVEEVAPAPGRS